MEMTSPMGQLELWGGHECTVNRVGDRYFDQTVRSGHQTRIEDLDQFADLGVKALRYPVIWERHAPDERAAPNFVWSDARIRRLSELKIRPIIGLIHHGSGPDYTNLLDDAFAEKLAAYAERVADRYGEVRDWTPVNEPLTTARFSALYGHWHPHARDERMFWVALLNQIDAVRLAMRAIRRSNPAARLIQTEDVGRTYSTPQAAGQARFDNTRAWASFDLLFGRLGPQHSLWGRLCGFGLEKRLWAILEDPAPPDVVGVNHYVTSDRFLDHRADLYPAERRGGNGRQTFADIEAVRALLPAPGGWTETLDRVFDRYRTPLAITECHLGCSREDQMRWFLEAWDAAGALRARGVPLEGVTAWSLLGAFNWSDLLTRDEGSYESGVFDLAGGAPRATALADLLRKLSAGAGAPDAAAGHGWWRRDVRLSHAPVFRSQESPEPLRRDLPPRTGRPLAILGASGALGQAFARACHWRGLAYVLIDRAEAPLTDEGALGAALARENPWAVINAAGYVRVDEAETDKERCFAVNTLGALALGRICAKRKVRLLSFSSDLVFNGGATRPYLESDLPGPLNVYGASKRALEVGLLESGCASLVVRSAAFFSAIDPYNFAQALAGAAKAGRPFEAAEDLVVSPTFVPDLVEAALDLLIDDAVGVWHLASDGARSWSDFASDLCAALGADPRLIRPRSWRSLGWAAARPPYTALASGRGVKLPPLEDGVERFARALHGAGFTPGRLLDIAPSAPASRMPRARDGHLQPHLGVAPGRGGWASPVVRATT